MRRATLTASAIALVSLANVSVASAAPGGLVTRLTRNPQQAVEFWTPQRMLLAVRRGGDVQATRDRTGVMATARPWWRDPSGARLVHWHNKGVRTVGKVFSLRRGALYECSGTLVKSANSSTIWTAGHCLYDDGAWNANVVFVPDYQPQTSGQSAPLGVWPAVSAATTRDWIHEGGSRHFRQDFGAFAVGRNSRGETIAQVVGAVQRISFGLTPRRRVLVLGFPGLPPFDGQHLWSCGPRPVGRALASAGRGALPIGISCDMTPGASGGPWLVNVNRAGIGTVISVTSTHALDHPITFAPFQGSTAREVYRHVARTRI